MITAAVRTGCPPPSPRAAPDSSAFAIGSSELEIDERRDAARGGDRDEEDRGERKRHLEGERARLVARLQRLEPAVRQDLRERAEREHARNRRRHGGAPARA